MPTQVTLDRYAEIRAEMEVGALRDEVLARAGLSVDEWTAAQREWLESMGAEIALGRFELTNRYSRAFVARQQTLTAARARVAAAPIVKEIAAAPAVEAAPRPAQATPSFLAAGAAADNAPPRPPPPAPAPAKPVVKPASPLLSGTMSVDVSAFRPALPFDPNAPAAPPAPAPSPTTPVVKRAPAALSGTSMGQVMPKGPAMPFAPAPAAPAANNPAPPAEPTAPVREGPVVKRAPAALAGTSMAFVAPKGPALPFAAAPAAPPAPAAPGAPAPAVAVSPAAPASPPAAPAAAPAVKRPPASLSGTSMAFVAPKGPALPFAKGNTAPPAPAETPTPKEERPPPAHAAPAAPPANPVVPPAPAAPVDTPPSGLSLEQYASLCVELGAAPANAAEIFKRYGITAEQGRAVDAYWKGRVSADPAARAAFDRAYHAYKAWLESARGKAQGPA